MQVVWHGRRTRRCKTGCAASPSFSAGFQGWVIFPAGPGLDFGLWSLWSLWSLSSLWSLYLVSGLCTQSACNCVPLADFSKGSKHPSISLELMRLLFRLQSSPALHLPSAPHLSFVFFSLFQRLAESQQGRHHSLANAAPTVAIAAAAAAPRAACLRVCPPTAHPSPPKSVQSSPVVV